MDNDDNKVEITSGEVAEQIKKILLETDGIYDVSPIMTDGMNELREGKDFSLYTTKDGKKQFTIYIVDNQ